MLHVPRATRFVLGCLDQYAGAIGTGAIRAGDLCETTGTVLSAVRCASACDSALARDVFCGPSFDRELYWQMSFSSTSANLLEHYRNQLPDKPSAGALSALAAASGDPAFAVHPYEEGQPIDECFRDVPQDAKPGEVTRAIMKRVAQSLAAQVKSLSPTERIQSIRSAGGAARSDAWLQIKSDTLSIPFTAAASEEPTSLGAAILAASALGHGSAPALSQSWSHARATFLPH
jgi:xylulokinase